MKSKIAEVVNFHFARKSNLDFMSRVLDTAVAMLELVLKSRNCAGWVLTSNGGFDVGSYVCQYYPKKFVVVAFGCEKEYWQEFMTYMVIHAKNKLFQSGHKRVKIEVHVSEYDVDSQVFLHNCGFLGRQTEDLVIMTFE